MIYYRKEFQEYDETSSHCDVSTVNPGYVYYLEAQLSAKDKEIDELKGEVSILAEISAYDIGLFKRMKDELEAHRAVIAKGVPVDIAHTGSTNIITNLPNALYGEFILLGLNEMEDDDG